MTVPRILGSDALDEARVGRINAVIDGAADDSVDFTTVALTDDLNAPIIEHVGDRNPAVVLSNRGKGMYVGDGKSPDETDQPHDGNRSFAVVTDEAGL